MPSPTDWWDRLYRSSDVTQLPWYTADLDPDIEVAVTRFLSDGGRILDLGTGPATQAIALAKRGFDVIATDISGAAVRKARVAARRAGVEVDFRADDILDSRLEDGLVSIIVDRGMFHVLPPEDRPLYVKTVHSILRPEGLLFLKTFSHKEPRSEGPYRFSPGDIRGYFGRAFDILSLEETTFRGALEPAPKALFAVLRRRGRNPQ